jgi:protein-S-isoprenylcysteine O-methyltransferase Ste14
MGDTTTKKARSVAPARLALRIVMGTAITGLLIWGFFVAAGGWGWWAGWAYIGLLTAGQIATAVIVKRRDPELLGRRAEVGEGTVGWDKVILGLFALTYCAELIVAAFDAGRGWMPLPGWLWPAGAALYVGGVAFVTWAMSVNTHFEKTVRIQTDRDHAVCDRGPYAHIRHPGYVGAILGFPLATPFLLGSGWAFAPAAVCVAVLVIRTAAEDRMLHAELPGYAEFAGRTRFRLLPGLW